MGSKKGHAALNLTGSLINRAPRQIINGDIVPDLIDRARECRRINDIKTLSDNMKGLKPLESAQGLGFEYRVFGTRGVDMVQHEMFRIEGTKGRPPRDGLLQVIHGIGLIDFDAEGTVVVVQDTE